MRCEGNSGAVPLFGDYGLTAREARQAIHAYSGAEMIWEWRGHEAECDYRAGVTPTLQARRADGTVVGQGDSPLAALADLLWRLALPTLLDEEAETPVRSVGAKVWN